MPAGWVRAELPGGGLAVHAHPGLPRAVAGDDRSWVLLLGEPVDVVAGTSRGSAVARLLADLLPGPGGIAAAQARAATLAGSWLVLLQTPDGSSVLADPLHSLGVHLLPGGQGVVSHASLSPSSAALGPASVAVAGPGDAGLLEAPLASVVDLPALAAAARDEGWTAARRLRRHVELLRARGPAWLGLAGRPADAGLLDLVGREPEGVSAVTWWDRAGDDEAGAAVVAASRAAVAAGLPHRVVGVREDVDGSDAGPGATARDAAARALALTWPDVPSPRRPVPVSDALDQALPRDAVVWLGARPQPASLGAVRAAHRPRSWDLVQGVRPVALPWSDWLRAELED